MNISHTLAERGARYGDFSDHAKIAQGLQRVMQKAERASPVGGQSARPLAWECLSDVQRQALTVIADKIARILSGDPNYADNWHDIQGYARLAEERLPVQQSAEFANDNQLTCKTPGPFGHEACVQCVRNGACLGHELQGRGDG